MLQGKFPESMKLADVSPLYKSKDQNECTNYRPTSLLLTISKLLEKIMYKRTYNFLEQTGQLYNSQYGFRTGHSCENAVSELLAEIIKGNQEGLYTVSMFLDLSKAFDTLEHEVLLKKLERYGIRGTANNWFRDYLTNRKKIHIKVDNITIQNTHETKFLGIWLDEYLNWTTHMQKLILKLTRNTNLLKYNQNLMPTHT